MKQHFATAVIFDLDGTLIDSYPGLQHAFDDACRQVYGTPDTYNIRPLIGPPMREIFKKLTGEANEEILIRFVKLFQAKYDAESYKMCALYPGAEDVLSRLADRQIDLFIATNKRVLPTRLVLEYLGISRYFKAVYCIDSVQPSYTGKVNMVNDILQNEQLSREAALLVGDTLHDQQGAEGNQVKFIYAGYGFGELAAAQYRITQLPELLDYL